MSQRALKKRELSLQKQQQQEETHQIYRKQPQPQTTQKSKYTQRLNATGVLSKQSSRKPIQIVKTNICESKRKFRSTPNLTKTSDTFHRNQLMRSHSESDLSSIPEANVLVNAKSEFHLKSIASTQVSEQSFSSSIHREQPFKLVKKSIQKHMMDNSVNNQNKRLSIQSGLSGQTAGSMTSSASDASTQPPTVGFCDTESIRIPIIGYEVMEERARFTVIQ